MKESKAHFKISAALYPSKASDERLLSYLRRRTERGARVADIVREGLEHLATVDEEAGRP